ncbi:YfiR family protein [candidate division KSB1 bacterium]
MKLKQYIVLLIIVFLIVPTVNISAQTKNPDNIKAAFIYNFSKYVSWPGTDNSETFNIGVIGENRLFPLLESIAEGKLANKKKILVKQFKNTEEIKDCHILLISQSENENLENILKRVGNKSTLTVGDTEKYAEKGVVINFVIMSEKIKIELNMEAAERAGLKISSQLQKLAIQVNEKK